MRQSRKDKRQGIRYRIRKTINGSAETPRLAVFRSNKQIYAQLIDDNSGTTITAASSTDASITDKKVNKIEQAKEDYQNYIKFTPNAKDRGTIERALNEM